MTDGSASIARTRRLVRPPSTPRGPGRRAGANRRPIRTKTHLDGLSHHRPRDSGETERDKAQRECSPVPNHLGAHWFETPPWVRARRSGASSSGRERGFCWRGGRSGPARALACDGAHRRPNRGAQPDAPPDEEGGASPPPAPPPLRPATLHRRRSPPSSSTAMSLLSSASCRSAMIASARPSPALPMRAPHPGPRASPRPRLAPYKASAAATRDTGADTPARRL